ncbi:MAG: STAS domain-containing protein [Anaerolineae bacterium]|jgi:anti-sigma B factor antagonist
MEITTRELEHSIVVKPSGRVDAEAAPELAEAFKAITDAGKFRIVLDLSETDFLSSAGLRVLLDTQKTCRRLNRGNMAIANVSPEVTRTLELGGFYTYFDIYDTVLEAVGNV